ncbi:MAG: HAD-IIA family hydrolase [Acidimicrobiia bacterium]
MAWLLDLDGVVWLSGRAIAGSVEAVARLRAGGERVVFVTNFSGPTLAQHEGRLAAIGIDAGGDVVTSAMAAARLVDPGARVWCLAGPGVAEAVAARGAEVVTAPPADAVMVGLTEAFDYASLRDAATAVRAGARLIGANDDPTMPTPDGEVPGAGSLLAAVAVASGVDAVVAGKPHQPMADAVLELVGTGPHVMVGDRWSTDGLFAERLGARFGLVLSGVTAASDVPAGVEPAMVAPDLVTLVDRLL